MDNRNLEVSKVETTSTKWQPTLGRILPSSAPPRSSPSPRPVRTLILVWLSPLVCYSGRVSVCGRMEDATHALTHRDWVLNPPTLYLPTFHPPTHPHNYEISAIINLTFDPQPRTGDRSTFQDLFFFIMLITFRYYIRHKERVLNWFYPLLYKIKKKIVEFEFHMQKDGFSNQI